MMSWAKYLNNGRLRPSERPIENDPRNDFESDFGRVIFSPATRRMHDKTQVFPLTADDNIHSRLTHSMEVMAIGHSLGIRVCQEPKFIKASKKDKASLEREIPVLLKTACLVHDIGNPPFGHFGEKVIQDFFIQLFNEKKFKLSKLEREDFMNFDGNAQGFRILTKLQVLDDLFGLNLTYASLGSFLKYPNAGKIQKKFLPLKKRGVFQSEKEYLDKVLNSCNLIKGAQIKRHPLAFLMEAADSICYLTMDIEDGFNKGWYNYEQLKEKLSKISGLEKIFKKIDKEKIECGVEVTRMVRLRISLISELVSLAVKNFIDNLDNIYSGKYNKELIFDDERKLAESLKTFCFKYVFSKREIVSLELTGHSVLTGLLNYYVSFVFHKDEKYRNRAQGLMASSIVRVAMMENGLKENGKLEELNHYYRLRVIVDFISGMTDQFAVDHYQKLSGQKIN